MNPQSPARAEPDRPVPTLSPRSPFGTAASGSHRKIAIAVDLSDESAHAVRWAVQNYLRPGDAVILLHVRPTSVLYGADWGSVDLSLAEGGGDGGAASTEESQRKKMEEDFDSFTATKASDLALPLVEAQIPFRIHIVKDHDMKERLCLEVERLGLSAVIMGSRGFGAKRAASKGGRLGSVSDYCVHHCVCPVVVVRLPEEKDGGDEGKKGGVGDEVEEALHPVPEEEHEEYHDASDEQKASQGMVVEKSSHAPSIENALEFGISRLHGSTKQASNSYHWTLGDA